MRLLILLLLPGSLYAEVIRYTDSEGKTHFVDAPSKVPSQYRDQVEAQKPLPGISKLPPAEYKESYKRTAASSSQKVEIFVTTWCPYCRQLETFLHSKKIAYTRYDVEKDRRGMEFYRSVGGGGVPVVRVGKQIMRGFDPDGILRALGRTK